MSTVKILAVGDVFLDREKPEEAFDHVRPLFNNADIVFGNCEGVYSNQSERVPSTKIPLIADPRGIKDLAKAHFTVMSLANNHSLDGGYKALFDTRSELNAVGIATCGAGENLADAHKPTLIEFAGRKMAILAYTSVFPHGYEARGEIPGLAVLRAYTYYAPWEVNEWHPGALPKVFTIPHEPDHKIFREDIAKAKKIADIVLVSIHWGDMTRPYVLTDHERRAARIAIDSGADVILGHHHHLIRGIEFYQGKPIFYGLGHFAFDLPNYNKKLAAEGLLLVGNTPMMELELTRRFGDYRLYQREGYPLLPFHPESRLTLIASLEFHDGKLEVNVIPCIIDKTNSPHLLKLDNPETRVVFDYLKKACESECLPTQIVYNEKHKEGFVKFQVLEKEDDH